MSLSFEERYPEIVKELDKRKQKWDLNKVEWEDARQLILIHINKKYHKFDETKKDKRGRPVEFRRWVNRVITRAIYGIWRDHLGKYSRPCVANVKNGYKRCVFNAGDELCSKTPSGKQCAECPLYKEWQCSKKSQHAIKQALPIENHTQEVSNIQSDFLDVSGSKTIIDKEMERRLQPHEWQVYKLLFIDGGTEQQAGKLLGIKKRKSGRMYQGYAQILKLRHLFRQIAKEIIEEEGLG